MTDSDREIYRAALIGFRAQVAEISKQIAEIERMLRQTAIDKAMYHTPLQPHPAGYTGPSAGSVSQVFQVAMRKALPAYRKLKSASFRNTGTGVLPQPRKKHNMTPAGRTRLSAAMKKRWRQRKKAA